MALTEEDRTDLDFSKRQGMKGILRYIFLLALTLRVLHFALSSENPLLYHPVLDEAYYIDLGRSIAGGLWKGEERTFFMDPLYGYLLGGIFSLLGENLTTVRLLQILLDSLNVLLIYWLGARLWSRSAGLIAGGIYAGYKVAFFYTLLILKATLSTTLVLLFTLSVLQGVRSRHPFHWFLMGLFAALLVYVHANLLLLVPLVVIFYYALERPKWRPFIKHTALFLLGFGVLMVPGGLRNYWVSGEMVFLNTQSGRLLYACNNPENLTGRYNVPSFSRPHPEDSEADFHREAERRVGRGLSAREVSSYWRGETVRFLIENPKAACLIIKNKLKGTLGDHEIPTNHSYEVAARFSLLGRSPMPTFALAFALGVPGLFIAFFHRKEALYLLMPLLTVLTTVMAFHTSSQFRMPAVPFLLVGAGIAVVHLWRWIRGRERIKAMGLVAVMGMLYLLSVVASEPRYTGAEEYSLATAYWSQKAFGKAQEVAEGAARRFPDQARFPKLLGMLAISENRLEEAVQYNLKALQIDPYHADAYHNLGLTHLLQGRAPDAVQAISKAISLEPRGRFFFSLGRAYEALGDREKAKRSYKEYLAMAKTGDPFKEEALKRLAGLDQK